MTKEYRCDLVEQRAVFPTEPSIFCVDLFFCAHDSHSNNRINALARIKASRGPSLFRAFFFRIQLAVCQSHSHLLLRKLRKLCYYTE
jgi:hypothetical protein